ncbi:MAG: MFS transporter [Pseudomonadales bacterium]|nr:MFS transporter [Pseudomonadales bacterium]
MSPVEQRATISLAILFMTRMLGLFMILPVFSIYGMELANATPLLVGVAIGAYGLTQALLQVPFGLCSDRFGRKPVIVVGLLIFLLGSIIAALSESIYGVIIGRAMQGAGAIASAVMALLADLTRDDNRTKAMAMVGASIGVSFTLALIIGPLVAGYSGLPGLFWLTALLAGLGVVIILFVVPTPVTSQWHRENRPVIGQFSEVMQNRELLRLDFGVFLLHLTLTASFVAMPLLLVEGHDFPNSEHWKLYLPVMLVAFVCMVPLMIVAEAKRRIREVFLIAILLLGCGLLMLYLWQDTLWHIALGLFVYFWAFNLLEAMLPSLVSKIAPPGSKGTSMGVYSASQFMGAFVGGSAGGYMLGADGEGSVFLLCAALAVFWLWIAFGMGQPKFLQSYRVELSTIEGLDPKFLVERFLTVYGVEEAVVILEERAAYLKVDRKRLDQDQLGKITSLVTG